MRYLYLRYLHAVTLLYLQVVRNAKCANAVKITIVSK